MGGCVWCPGCCADSAQTDLWRRLQQRGTAIFHQNLPTGVAPVDAVRPAYLGVWDFGRGTCRRPSGCWCACLAELCLCRLTWDVVALQRKMKNCLEGLPTVSDGVSEQIWGRGRRGLPHKAGGPRRPHRERKENQFAREDCTVLEPGMMPQAPD